MLRGQEERKYSIRKYSIGVVSVLAATMFVVTSHEAQASEKTPTTNAAAQKETLNQPGEQGNAITSHQMQSGKQLDDMHKENGKSGTVTEGKDTLQSSKHQSTQNSKTIRTQNDNQVKQDSERQGSKQSHQKTRLTKLNAKMTRFKIPIMLNVMDHNRQRHNRMMLINHNHPFRHKR